MPSTSELKSSFLIPSNSRACLAETNRLLAQLAPLSMSPRSLRHGATDDRGLLPFFWRLAVNQQFPEENVIFGYNGDVTNTFQGKM